MHLLFVPARTYLIVVSIDIVKTEDNDDVKIRFDGYILFLAPSLSRSYAVIMWESLLKKHYCALIKSFNSDFDIFT